MAARWDDADVFVIPAPTAFGKTKVIEAIARYASKVKKLKSHVLVPTNVLVDQVAASTKMFALKARANYTCYTPTGATDDSQFTNCEQHHKACGEHCAGCPYVQDVRKVHAFPFSLSNYHTALAHRLEKPVILIDEAHMVLPLIREAEARHIWLPVNEAGRSVLPHYLTTYGQVADYLAAHPELQGKGWDTVRKELEGGHGRFLLARGERKLRGKPTDCLSLLPIDTRFSERAPAFLGGRKVQKLFLLSGTISRTDVEQMALQGKRVLYFQTESPIPVERRPVIRDYVAKMSYQNQQVPAVLDALAQKVLHYWRQAGGRTLVHAPYGLAVKLQARLAPVLGDLLLCHANAREKEAVLAKFKDTGDSSPYLLIGSGMEEGIDLYGEDYKMQLVCKVPYASLADPAWKWVADEQPDRYAWEAIKKVVQAAGRICRGPDDYGTTVILDESFERLFRKYETDLLPPYFAEAVR